MSGLVSVNKDRLPLREMFGLIGVEVPEAIASLPFPGHVATDSHCVEPGGAFVALEGERTDGHVYIPQALERGAGLLVVRRGKAPEGTSIPWVELEEPEMDLARMASAYLERAGVKEVVAVTGSVGKTTTRAALQQVLSGHFRLHASSRSLNTRIGCTSTVLAMPLGTELLLLEFGANKPGEIAELTALFPPTTALITEVAPVHLEGFGTLEGVLRGKMEIVGSRRLRRFLYNADNPLLSAAAHEDLNVAGVGTGETDFRILAPHFAMRPPRLTFRLQKQDRKKHADLSAAVWGEHLAFPLAFAAATANLLEMPLEDCAAALGSFRALPGRGRILELGDRFIIDDAYNANPLSMGASLRTFAGLSMDGRLAVLGEMRELGPDAARYHGDLAPLLDRLEGTVLVGALWREAVPARSGRVFVDTWQEALEALKGRDWKGLLVKGSNSLGLQNVVRALCPEEGGK